MRLQNSSVFCEVFQYLPYFEQVHLQQVSRLFYVKIVPKYLYTARLSAHTTNAIFSYSVGEPEEQPSLLWKYDVINEKWLEIKPVFADASGVFKFQNSMSALVTDMNRVFFLGGSHTEDFTVLSDMIYEWHVPSHTVKK